MVIYAIFQPMIDGFALCAPYIAPCRGLARDDPPASSSRGAVDRLAHYRPFSDGRALEMNHADISTVDAVDGLLTKFRNKIKTCQQCHAVNVRKT